MRGDVLLTPGRLGSGLLVTHWSPGCQWWLELLDNVPKSIENVSNILNNDSLSLDFLYNGWQTKSRPLCILIVFTLFRISSLLSISTDIRKSSSCWSWTEAVWVFSASHSLWFSTVRAWNCRVAARTAIDWWSSHRKSASLNFARLHVRGFSCLTQ